MSRNAVWVSQEGRGGYLLSGRSISTADYRGCCRGTRRQVFGCPSSPCGGCRDSSLGGPKIKNAIPEAHAIASGSKRNILCIENDAPRGSHLECSPAEYCHESMHICSHIAIGCLSGSFVSRASVYRNSLRCHSRPRSHPRIRKPHVTYHAARINGKDGLHGARLVSYSKVPRARQSLNSERRRRCWV